MNDPQPPDTLSAAQASTPAPAARPDDLAKEPPTPHYPPAAWHLAWADPAIAAARLGAPSLPRVPADDAARLQAAYFADWADIWAKLKPANNVDYPPQHTDQRASQHADQRDERDADQRAAKAGDQSTQKTVSTSAGARSSTPPRDRYFSSDAWSGTAAHRLMVDLYKLNARTLQALADALEGDAQTRARVRFLVDQWVAAMSPANVFALNPDAQRALIASHGATLQQGIANLVRDLGTGQVTQSDPAGFEVGRDLASTPGAVIFETPLCQLIHYRPTVSTVFERPLLIVPPCINKYYILDLRPNNSLVKYALDAGQQVFMISWCNPGMEQAASRWDDYVETVRQALDVVESVAGIDRINALGFCVGGALLACAAALEQAHRAHLPGGSRIAALTLLTTMLDYADTGVLDVFIDEAHVQMRERTIGGHGAAPGLMRASEFANTFSLLRPRDLFWNYVVGNYMLGDTPPAFDLLFWNADSTNLPGPMFSWYLRHLYLENQLREPGRLTVCGVPIDLSTLTMPTFVYGSRDDHIVPWRSAYASVGLLGGPTRFVLGASGHIAGVINPPVPAKRSFWTIAEVDAEMKTDACAPAALDADAWQAAAFETPGSWWPYWSDWLASHAGARRPLDGDGGNDRAKRRRAPSRATHPTAVLGNEWYPVIEPAPGRYVKQQTSSKRGMS